MNNRTIGDIGEEAACRYLKRKRLKIVCRNYSKPYGEIDIIAETRKLCIFIEVKTRKNKDFGLPCQFVTPQKQARIVRAASTYCVEHEVSKMCRFDIVEVLADHGRILEINHIEDAFQPEISW